MSKIYEYHVNPAAKLVTLRQVWKVSRTHYKEWMLQNYFPQLFLTFNHSFTFLFVVTQPQRTHIRSVIDHSMRSSISYVTIHFPSSDEQIQVHTDCGYYWLRDSVGRHRQPTEPQGITFILVFGYDDGSWNNIQYHTCAYNVGYCVWQ